MRLFRIDGMHGLNIDFVNPTPADVAEWVAEHPEAVDVLLSAIGEKRALVWALTKECNCGISREVAEDGPTDRTCDRCDSSGRAWREQIVNALAHHIMVESWVEGEGGIEGTGGFVSPPIEVADRTLARLLDAAGDTE